MKDIYRVVVIPDLQIPYQDERSLSVVERYISDHKWDELIWIGDFMDFDYLSSFNEDSPRKLEGKRMANDYRYAGMIMDRQIAAASKKNPECKFTLLEGNHEFRVEKAIDKAPMLEGWVEVPTGLKLAERGVKWIRSWSKNKEYKIGKAIFLHGVYTNKYHASKMVDAYGTNVFYGHTHDVMCMPKVTKGDHKTRVGQSLGCLCEYNQSYMKGKPSNWQQAFGIFYFRPDGNFTYYVPQIIRSSFIDPEGNLYE